jgi:hypothetical protein
MSFSTNHLNREQPINSYREFWAWFQKNEKSFHNVVRMKGNFEKDFFDVVSPKLVQLTDGLFLLSGMFDETTAELIITPDGDIPKIVFAEEIVAAAPVIQGWKFTALKPPMGSKSFGLRMRGFEVTDENLYFVANEFWDRPDEIDISIVHKDLTDENKEALSHAVFIFLDNYLGELEFATAIDNLTIAAASDVEKEPKPVGELQAYLGKRQSEFVEKYDGFRMNTDDDSFTMMEWELENGNPLIAVINTTLLKWDRKPSHPWIAIVQFNYSDKGNAGMPSDETYQLLSEIEDIILNYLKDFDGFLNIGRETGNYERVVYFACKDFRKPSKVFDQIQKKYSDRFQIESDIYKDKYWKTFDRFLPVENDEQVNQRMFCCISIGRLGAQSDSNGAI